MLGTKWLWHGLECGRDRVERAMDKAMQAIPHCYAGDHDWCLKYSLKKQGKGTKGAAGVKATVTGKNTDAESEQGSESGSESGTESESEQPDEGDKDKDAKIKKLEADVQTMRDQLASSKESYSGKERELKAVPDQLEEEKATSANLRHEMKQSGEEQTNMLLELEGFREIVYNQDVAAIINQHEQELATVRATNRSLQEQLHAEKAFRGTEVKLAVQSEIGDIRSFSTKETIDFLQKEAPTLYNLVSNLTTQHHRETKRSESVATVILSAVNPRSIQATVLQTIVELMLVARTSYDQIVFIAMVIQVLNHTGITVSPNSLRSVMKQFADQRRKEKLKAEIVWVYDNVNIMRRLRDLRATVGEGCLNPAELEYLREAILTSYHNPDLRKRTKFDKSLETFHKIYTTSCTQEEREIPKELQEEDHRVRVLPHPTTGAVWREAYTSGQRQFWNPIPQQQQGWGSSAPRFIPPQQQGGGSSAPRFIPQSSRVGVALQPNPSPHSSRVGVALQPNPSPHSSRVGVALHLSSSPHSSRVGVALHLASSPTAAGWG
ncbi:Hypp6538 [Branchiostoma lanceolatum]|uniref:Hypp6538 protein n=1 Tax=Branchiostoma lanceolatum TaxID=7740 RepID=A0A8J9YV11_BRALA|nr:Hypp6538 [Branchiostoma lanceolatum]